MTTRPRGFITWKPRNETAVLLAEIITILAIYVPTYGAMTVRQIFYRLVATIGFSKTESDYKRLGEIIAKARRASIIEFDQIRDDGDTLIEPRGFRSYEQFVRGISRTIDSFTLRRDIGQRFRTIIMVEASGMAPQVARAAGPYGATVMSAGGFNGLTGKYELATSIVDTWDEERRPTRILHIGDHDPSGVHVYSALAEDVTAFVREMAGAGGLVEFQRIAVTPEQIEEFSLPTAPAKSTDQRSFAGVGGDTSATVQAEALDPGILAQIVVDAILEEWDDDIESDLIERERNDKARLRDLFQTAFGDGADE